MSAEDDFLAPLFEQARRNQAYAEEQTKRRAALTDAERDVQDRFQEFMDAPTIEYMARLSVTDPLDLLALGDAYYRDSQRLRALAKKPTRHQEATLTPAEQAEAAAIREQCDEKATRSFFAAMTMVAIWLKTRHPDAEGMPDRIPLIPPPPANWKGHRKRVGFAMGYGLEPAEVVSIDDLRAARAA